MHWMRREWLCDRLRVSLRQSYRLVPSGYGARVSSEAVLSLVNRARRAVPEPFADTPSDILTADELAKTPELAESGLTPRLLLAMTRRKRAESRPPHLRFNKQTTRFVRSRFLAWLDERAASARRTGRRRVA